MVKKVIVIQAILSAFWVAGVGLAQVPAPLPLPYGQASDTGTRDLYLRHGYTLLPELRLPDDGPTMYPMWREPSA